MNPSTADILAAIEATPGDEVLVLPNNSNVILTRRAGGRSSPRSRCGSSRPARCRRGSPRWSATSRRSTADENEAAMLEALGAGRDGRGDGRVARRRAERRRGAEGRVPRARRGEAVASSARLRATSRAPSSSGCSPSGARGADAADGRRRAGARRHPAAARGAPSGGRARRPAGRPAALPAALWRPSERGGRAAADPRPPRRGQRRLPRRRSSCCSGCRRTSRSSAPSPTAGRGRRLSRARPDVVVMDYRLPGHGRRRGDGGGPRGVPGRRRRLPDRVGGPARGRRAAGGRRGRVPAQGSGARRDRGGDPSTRPAGSRRRS